MFSALPPSPIKFLSTPMELCWLNDFLARSHSLSLCLSENVVNSNKPCEATMVQRCLLVKHVQGENFLNLVEDFHFWREIYLLLILPLKIH